MYEEATATRGKTKLGSNTVRLWLPVWSVRSYVALVIEKTELAGVMKVGSN